MNCGKTTYKKKRKEFGAKSFKGPDGRKLRDKFEGILSKSYSKRDLDQKRLKVIDEKGRVLKEISLDEQETKIKIRSERTKRDWDGKKVTTRKPLVSDNKMFGAVMSNTVKSPGVYR